MLFSVSAELVITKMVCFVNRNLSLVSQLDSFLTKNLKSVTVFKPFAASGKHFDINDLNHSATETPTCVQSSLCSIFNNKGI
jgi:hypothetical protein